MLSHQYSQPDTQSYYMHGHYTPLSTSLSACQPLAKTDQVPESNIPLYHDTMYSYPSPLDLSTDSGHTPSTLDVGFWGDSTPLEILPQKSLGLPAPPSPIAQSVHSVSPTDIFSHCTPSDLTSVSSVESSPLLVEGVTDYLLSFEPSRAAMKGHPLLEPSRASLKADPVAAARMIIPREEASYLRETLVREVIMSDWWLNNEAEPDRRVFSPYIRRHSSKSFECLICRKKIPRIDRAVDHVRVHMMHRPYPCLGKRPCLEYKCPARFYTKDCLKSHRERNKLTCDKCGTEVEDKNLKRHKATRKCKRTRSHC